MDKIKDIGQVRIFNTPLEIGLRCLIILNNKAYSSVDKDQLMFLDYLALNTSDIKGPDSLHAPIPNRGVQVYAKKDLIQEGLKLMLSKGLLTVKTNLSGFGYSINPEGEKFLTYFSSEYFNSFVDRVLWISERFKDFSTIDLKHFIDENLQDWGSEFEPKI